MIIIIRVEIMTSKLPGSTGTGGVTSSVIRELVREELK